MRFASLAVIAVVFFLVQVSKELMPEDNYWKIVNVFSNNIRMTNGNLTYWKAVAACGDNSTVRPNNETRLINYVNTTWCKGNQDCMTYMPKNDIRFYYFTENQTDRVSPENPLFWMWVTRASFITTSRKFVTCSMDYFPRWDSLYVCQAFMPSPTNEWFYGVRWFCGSTSYQAPCVSNGYLMPKAPQFMNMTG